MELVPATMLDVLVISKIPSLLNSNVDELNIFSSDLGWVRLKRAPTIVKERAAEGVQRL